MSGMCDTTFRDFPHSIGKPRIRIFIHMKEHFKSVAKWSASLVLTVLLEYLFDRWGFSDSLRGFFEKQSNIVADALSTSIPLWRLLAFGIILGCLYMLFSRFIPKKKPRKSKTEIFWEAWQQFKRENEFNKIEAREHLLLKTIPDIAGDRMFIREIHPYCGKHDEPARMAHDGDFYKCHKAGCDYSCWKGHDQECRDRSSFQP